MVLIYIFIFYFFIIFPSTLSASSDITFYKSVEGEGITFLFTAKKDDPFLQTGLFEIIKHANRQLTETETRYSVQGTIEEFKEIKNAYNHKDKTNWNLEIFNLIGTFIDMFPLEDQNSSKKFLKEKYKINKAFFDKISLLNNQKFNEIIPQFKHITWLWDTLYIAKVQQNPDNFLNYIHNNSVELGKVHHLSSNKRYVWDEDHTTVFDLKSGQNSRLPNFVESKYKELGVYFWEILDDYTYVFSKNREYYFVKFDKNNSETLLYNKKYKATPYLISREKIGYYIIQDNNTYHLMFYDDNQEMFVQIELPNFSGYNDKENNPNPSLLCHLAKKGISYIIFSPENSTISLESSYTKTSYDFAISDQQKIECGIRLKLKHRADVNEEFVMFDLGPTQVCIKYPLTEQISFIYDYYNNPYKKSENHQKLKLSYENNQTEDEINKNKYNFAIDVQDKPATKFHNTYLENPAFLLFFQEDKTQSPAPKSYSIISIETLRSYLDSSDDDNTHVKIKKKKTTKTKKVIPKKSDSKKKYILIPVGTILILFCAYQLYKKLTLSVNETKKIT